MSEQTEKHYDEQDAEKLLEDVENNLEKKVVVAIVGKVSTGKSSLLNALFNKTKADKLAHVGAISGVTTKVTRFQLGKNVEIMDSPGLGDIIKENSDATRIAMGEIDVGILVVSDSADESQKAHYDELKAYCKKVFVVLNKIDIYDKKKSALDKVTNQWSEVLNLNEEDIIYQTCADGYDPDYDDDIELDIRGIDVLKRDILQFLKKYGKALVLEREMEKKSVLAKRIIYSSLVAVAGAAFIPGSAVYITGIQGAAIMSIHYVYTGEALSKKSAVAALPLFASQSIGSSLFLVAKSFLPPTGIIDVAAAGVAAGVTIAMLSTVNWVYENDYNLDDKKELKEQYQVFYGILKNMGLKEIWDIVKTRDRKKIMELLSQFVK